MTGKKTYIIAALMILHALGSYALGREPQVNVTEILGALGLAALRAGVAKGPAAAALLAALAFACSGGLATAAVPVAATGTHQSAATTAATLLAPANNPGRVYLDAGLSLRTPNFTDADYGYGIRLGYQATKHWGADIGVTHAGLDAAGSVVQSVNGRLVARMPFGFLAPYTFLGGAFDLERDAWHLQPGGGIEIGVSKKLKGVSLYAEGGLDADLKGRSGYLFGAGVRLRF